MRDDYSKQASGKFEPFPVLQSKGADGQQRIEAQPDAEWEWKKPGKPPILEKAGHLLVSMGHGLSTARLTAVASDERHVGQGWMPVTGLDAAQAKAAAVFLNSTPGRLLILRCPGKKLRFPFYNPAVWRDLPIPNLEDDHIRETLAACWRPPATQRCRSFVTATAMCAAAGTRRSRRRSVGTPGVSPNSANCSPKNRL